MRRKDREITDKNEIISIMERCDVVRIAIHDEPYPYIVPLNFGMQVNKEEITLYFHSALEGKKVDLIKNNPHVCFEMDRAHRLVMIEEEGNCTMEYESVIGQGEIEFVKEEEKMDALRILLHHYRNEDFPLQTKVVPHTLVWKLHVTSCTGKKRKKKESNIA